MGSSYRDLHAWLSGSLCVAKGGFSWVFNSLHFYDNLSPARVLGSVLTRSYSLAREHPWARSWDKGTSMHSSQKAGSASGSRKEMSFCPIKILLLIYICIHPLGPLGIRETIVISIFSKWNRNSKMMSQPSKNCVALWGISDSLKIQVYTDVYKIQWGLILYFLYTARLPARRCCLTQSSFFCLLKRKSCPLYTPSIWTLTITRLSQQFHFLTASLIQQKKFLAMYLLWHLVNTNTGHVHRNLLRKEIILVRASFAMINHHDQKQLVEERVDFSLLLHIFVKHQRK